MVDAFVPTEVAQDRMARLTDVVERHALAKHNARIGRTEAVVVEGPSKKDPSVLSGRTRQNKLLHFTPPPAGAVAPGDRVDVRVVSAAPHWLRGEFVATRGTARRARPRIPITVV